MRKNRIKREKIVIAILLVAFFLIPYLVINRLPVSEPSFALNTMADEAIPFIPAFIIIYLSTYMFAFIPLRFIRDRQYFKRVAIAYAAVMAISYVIFLLFPTIVVRPRALDHDVFSRMLGYFYSLDLPYRNNFPSLHVAIASLAALASFGYAKKYWWTLMWAIAIAVSTLFVKQHDLADVVAGIALGAIAYLAIVRRS